MLECTIKKLNQQNNEVQQHIRSNKDKNNQKIVDVLLKQYKTSKESLKSLTLQLEKDSLHMNSEEYMIIESKCNDLKEMIVRIEILFDTINKDITQY